MPQTSLSQQLKRLAAPQTSQLVDKTSKPSLLFDFKEAANIDRDTFYSIGLSGLEELEAINPVFKRYERTLFDSSSISFVRSIEPTEKNKKLDEEINRFIFHCSPYFLLNPTHKALEWLINRFQIQDYNTDSLMMLALPYYGTTTFAQVVQLLNLNVNVSWSWLRLIKREGTPLSRTALLNRAATDMSFFKFVCNMPLLATKVCQGKEGNCLSSLFTFYCTTVIGALQHTYNITDLHISNLLPSIMSGLCSEVDDYIASSYMILSCLAAKIQLSSTILQSLFTKVIQVSSECMRTEAVLLMVILCQCNSAVSEKSLKLLIKAEWFIPCFTKVAQSGVVVFPLITDMMTICIEVIDAKKEILTEVKQLVINLLEKVHFNDDEAEHIFRLFIDACAGKKRKATLNWTVQLLQSLEKRYPQSFDIVISDSKYSVIAKQIMGLRDDYQGQSDLFERLHHPNPKIRTLAVEAIPHQLEPVQSSWLSETILERLSDDCPYVVMAAISLPVDYLQSLIGRSDLVNCLTKLAGKIWSKKKWLKTASKIFILLGELLSSDFDELTLLKITVPFLFVPQSDLSPAANAILSSKLPNFSNLLKSIRQKLKNKTSTNNTFLSKAVWVSLHDPFSFSLQVDENAIKICHSESSIFKFVTILFASASFPSKSDPSHSVELVLLIDNLLKESELVYVQPLELNVKTLNVIASYCQRDKLPVQVIQHFLCTVISKTDIKMNKINCWWDMSDASQKFLYNVFKTSLGILDACNSEYFPDFFDKITSELKQKTHFVKPEDYCKMLCNIIVKSPDIALECLNEIKGCLQKQNREEIVWTVELSQNNVIMPTLLIGLSSKRKEVRELVFDVMNYIYSNMLNFESPYLQFMKELLSWEDEISCDSEQMYVAMYMILSPDPAVQSGYPKELQYEMIKVCKTLFCVTVDETTPPHIVASLLQLLVYVNSVDILKTLIPLAVKMLNCQDITEDQKVIVESVIKKIEPAVISVFEDDETWILADKCLRLHDTRILIGSDKKPPAILFLKMISEQVFDGLPEKGKCKLLDLAVAMNANSENGEANIAVMGMVKRIVLDASFVLPLLVSMKDVRVTLPENAQKRRRSWHRPPLLEILRTVDWKKGMSLLELIQNKKKINNVQILLPTLFDILKRCLEFSEQSPVEYTKQLLLSTILHFCQKLSEEGKLVDVPKQIFQVELIVQCIRESQNPQTHQHALLVLVEVAALVPDKVLHDIMPIFTFVGSSVLRMDDSYSFQIILKIIEAVVPILVKSIKGAEDSLSVQQVLQVFVDALLDIPEHRRFTLLLKLITTLDSDGSYLWLFICLVAQSEILSSNPSKPQSENVTKSYEKGKLKILKDLCLEFPAVVLIRTMYHVTKHVASLPHDKDGKSGFKKRNSAHLSSSIFDVEKNTGKQLRHYKYILINFISSFLATPSFIDMILVHNNNDVDENLVANFKLLVHEVLDYLQAVSIQVNKTVNQPSSKYWKAMQHVVEDIHGKVNAVLPNSIFLNMMRSILSVNCPTKIQRKMMEILNWRLQSTALDEDGLVSLVPVILAIIQSDVSGSVDTQIARQAAFITLKLLARQAGTSHPSEFVKALACVTDVVKKGLKEEPGESNDAVLASAVLCLAEMVATLGSKAIQFLPKFMPAIIQTVSRARSDPDVPEVLLLSVVTTVEKVLEHHANFINPYLDRIFMELCMISSAFHEKNSSQKSNVNSKLDAIRKTLAEKLDLRVLLPAVESSYSELIEQEEYGAISYLMSLLSDSLIGMYDLKDLQKFLIKTLIFRSDIRDPDANKIVEPAVISCTISMVLKMNEQEFKSFYNTLIKRMLMTNCDKEHVKHKAITFYNLCGSLAETLKSIFVPYAKDFLLNAADILNSCNTAKCVGNKRLFFKDKDSGKKDSEEMVKSILTAFLTIFRYDTEHFITEDRFNVIMKPLVDQLENDLCISDDTLENLLISCLALMATSINDDTLWKKYNYEILLKTQHERVKVRLAAVKTTCEVAKKLGDSYLPLLPEAIPFLSELLEDEDETVENTCRSVVQDLESVLGEEISKFF